MNILDNDVGDMGGFILKKQCSTLDIPYDDIEPQDLSKVALRLSNALSLFGKEKANTVYMKVKKLGEKTWEAGGGGELAHELDMAEAARMVGNLHEARDHIDRAEKDGALNAPELASRFLLLRGDLHLREGDKNGSMEDDKEARSLAEVRGNEEEVQEAEYGMGNVLWRKGEYEKGSKIMLKCAERCKKANNPRMAGKAYMALANISDEWGRFEEMQSYAKKSKAALKEANDERGLATLHNNLGVAYARHQRFEESLGEYKECIRMAKRVGYRSMEGWAMFNAAENCARMGRSDEALDLCEESEAIFKKLEDRLGMSGVYMSFAVIYWLREDPKRAERYFQRTISIRRDLDMPYRTADALYEYGCFLAEHGNVREARETLSESLRIFSGLKNGERTEQLEQALKRLEKH